MKKINDFNNQGNLSVYIHEIFSKAEYKDWRCNLKSFQEGKWHSLIASLNKHTLPLDRLYEFGNSVYSKLVFNYVKAPDYKESQMLMIQFTVSGTLWSCTIWHCPEHN